MRATEQYDSKKIMLLVAVTSGVSLRVLTPSGFWSPTCLEGFEQTSWGRSKFLGSIPISFHSSNLMSCYVKQMRTLSLKARALIMTSTLG